jgi:O-antigen ligase
MILVVIFSKNNQNNSYIFSTTEVKYYLLLYVIMILGIPFAYHKGNAFEAVIVKYLPNIAFFLVCIFEVDSLKKLKTFLFTICLATFIFSFFGYLIGSDAKAPGRLQLYGSAFDPNDTAYILLSLFPLCIFFLQFNQGLIKKLIAITAIISSLGVILLTGSRGGMVGLGAVLLVAMLTRIGGLSINRKLIILMILVGVYLLVGDKIDMERYLTLTNIQSDYNATDETGRTAIWRHAISIILDHPIMGVGPESFPEALANNRLKQGLVPKWQTVHNSYIQIAAEVGIIGFFIFIALNLRCFSIFYRINRMLLSESEEISQISTLGGLMFLGFVGHCVSSFFLSQGYSMYFTLYFALAVVIWRLQVELSTNITSSQKCGKFQNSLKAMHMTSIIR